MFPTQTATGKKKADAMRPPQVRRKNRTHKGRNSGKPLRVSHL